MSKILPVCDIDGGTQHRQHDRGLMARPYRGRARCHTWARSYASARREIIDAAELWLDELGVESLDNLHMRDEVRIAGAAQARDLAEAREELTRRLAEVRARVDETARGLVAEGISVRDVADLRGISPGRVSQVTRHSPCSA